MQGLNQLIQAMSRFSKRIINEKVEGIVYPDFVPVNQDGGKGLLNVVYYSEQTSADLSGGLITESTTSVDRTDITFGLGQTPIVSWANTIGYTERELEILQANSNIDVAARKMASLNRVANQILQQTAFVGHTKGRLTGLLNNSQITAAPTVTTGDWNTKTGMELYNLIYTMFLKVYEQTDFIEAPSMIAIPSREHAILAGKELKEDGGNGKVLESLLIAMEGAVGKPVSIKPMPGKYGLGAGKTGANRIIAYINDEEHLEMNVPVAPEALPIVQKSPIEIETGMRMDFGGVTFYEPKSAFYIDYKTS